MEEIVKAVKQAAKDLFSVEVEPELSRPEEQFGDYTTNVALQLAGKLGRNPREVAIALASKLHGQPLLAEVNVAGPGFINLKLTDEELNKKVTTAADLPKSNEGKEILVEFGDPNPFKEMHIGHLYSYLVGDAISNLLEASGAKVQRLSYHGDVGPHVARAIFGLRELKKEREGRGASFDSIPVEEIDEFLKMAYAYGAKKYEEDEGAKTEIENINLHIYQHDDPMINELHEAGCKLSFSYFDKVLQELHIKTDKRYLESESAPAGLKSVRKRMGAVFKESEGAVIFEGEKVGLHTRVFINSRGLPTYEAKDLGLTELKNNDFPNAAQSIIITANEQTEYFKVMLAALKEFDKELANKTTHLAHGFLSLSTGKMSSRTGEVFGAVDLLRDVKQTLIKKYPDSPEGTDLAAIKYGFLKHRLGTDIVYDVAESISLEGNSGPYLQYAHARARNILVKAGEKKSAAEKAEFDKNERSLARKISEYPEVVEKATQELLPHYVATYLYELAQVFNRFYEKSRVIGDERENVRLKLVDKYASVLKNGLGLLGITAPDKM
jgi:arginyl-tRNA synthetase